VVEVMDGANAAAGMGEEQASITTDAAQLIRNFMN